MISFGLLIAPIVVPSLQEILQTDRRRAAKIVGQHRPASASIGQSHEAAGRAGSFDTAYQIGCSCIGRPEKLSSIRL